MTKMLLTTAVLLLGFASFTAAHAEWEILDSGSAVYAGSTATNQSAGTSSDQSPVTSSGTTGQVAQGGATSK